MSARHSHSRPRQLTGPVLIGDDDPDVAKLTKRTLETAMPGCDARTFGSGKALIEYLEDEGSHSDKAAHPSPAIILLDLKMPEMDGFDVMEWLGARPQHAQTPVIVLSAFDELANLKRAFALRARGFLVKPMNVDSLRSILSSLNIAC